MSKTIFSDIKTAIIDLMEKCRSEDATERPGFEVKDPWTQFLEKIKNSVDDALIIYKGDEESSCGIYAQILKDNFQNKLSPTLSEIEQWIKDCELIKSNCHPSSTINCTFTSIEERDIQKKFYVIEYNENFIRTHLVTSKEQLVTSESLFFSQTQDYIFVGYCNSAMNKVKTPSQTFCAIESLARFIRDCENYQKMEEINVE